MRCGEQIRLYKFYQLYTVVAKEPRNMQGTTLLDRYIVREQDRHEGYCMEVSTVFQFQRSFYLAIRLEQSSRFCPVPSRTSMPITPEKIMSSNNQCLEPIPYAHEHTQKANSTRSHHSAPVIPLHQSLNSSLYYDNHSRVYDAA